ncbi:phosphotransferase [Deinococcus cellulosilyticus]|uniref:Trifolitoxin immunity domain-containing protein n=1 Tax=Deinococcus cellulosilyticus (strain DSM 18568 / NBRC 106333 / KACC 11606 / 5516J-15) TaxID=1223518 RepID=A0A511N232_DEIC1|nr:phosphotransferase [Deinococcus cellulosilyticus]GEM46912.1 trifolitoxin immunity domain-containing protein [Deinococcus cellulosilyticus NBRC 106333 = KACC 11606]
MEEPLTGGNMTAVVRIGERVHRSAGPWSSTIQQLLRHVRELGVRWVPEPFGFDSQGREVLEFLEGEVPGYPLPQWVWERENLQQSARMLRAFHDATRGLIHLQGVWQSPVHEPTEVICHNDFAPYNFVFREGKLLGVIDFDTCSPGPAIWDVAYLAYRMVPLTRPETFTGIQFADDEVKERLHLLLDAYGAPFGASDLLEVVEKRLLELAEFSTRQAERKQNPELLEHAALYRADAAHVQNHGLKHWV